MRRLEAAGLVVDWMRKRKELPGANGGGHAPRPVPHYVPPPLTKEERAKANEAARECLESLGITPQAGAGRRSVQ